MKACREFESLLPAYRENTLAAAEAERVRAHLDACPACREHPAALDTAFASLRDLPSWPAGDPVMLAERAREHWQRRARQSFPKWLWQPALAAALLLLALIAVRCWWPAGSRLPVVAHAPGHPAIAPPQHINKAVPPTAAPKLHPDVAIHVPSPAGPSHRVGKRPALRTPKPTPAAPRDQAAPIDDPFSSYVAVVADAMRAKGETGRPCVVLPLQPGTPESAPCADVATVTLVAELGRLDPNREVRRLPPWPVGVEVSPDGAISPSLRALARDVDGYLILGRLTPREQGVDIALYVIDGRDGSVVLDGAHPVRFDGV